MANEPPLTSFSEDVLDRARRQASDLNRPVSHELLQWAVLEREDSVLRDVLDQRGILEDAQKILLEIASSPVLGPPVNTARDADGTLIGYLVETDDAVQVVDSQGEPVPRSSYRT